MGRKPELKVMEWKEKYGDIFSMFTGRRLTVVLSDVHTLRKVFNEDASSGRAHQSTQPKFRTCRPDGVGLLSAQGELWKVHRRFALSTLRDLGMGKNWMEDSIIAEVEGICQALRDTNGNPSIRVQLINSVSNVITALIFGQRF
ncbi:putative Cytochrome P450 2B11 [Hypsibius exemplaris]|uniref:Cytochrome P450 2B11 n=1 Tax=Hypsibius exemplaris TaxID=2072580 RepID=A0A1W0WQF9_HYPEX|nr:putative Cytochrome P450 2B11 [Hypsibius exemplaris]